VGKLVFSNAAGSTFLCSGTLINNAIAAGLAASARN